MQLSLLGVTSVCRHDGASTVHPTPIATSPSKHLPQSFFARPAEVVAPELIGCLLVMRQPSGELLWGLIVETEAYCQSEPACHGHRRRTPSNETLFGEAGRFYAYLSYGIHHCVNVVQPAAAGQAQGRRLPSKLQRVSDQGLSRCLGLERQTSAGRRTKLAGPAELD